MIETDNKNTEIEKQKTIYVPVPVSVTDTWAGAVKEFFKQAGAITGLLIFVLFIAQACQILDLYRLLGM